ncbi:MAG: cobalt-precorrin-8X methylmutase [Planktothrix sp.]|uniref:cobalt-precorrin-8X methylmutase n=1 Tax=Planktothrix sp. TaxID=3088171 RepID=UPI0038D35539
MSIEIHPIQSESFAIIDQEIGEHSFNSAEYAILRRVIHSTADFEFSQLIRFSPNAIEQGILALKQQVPIIVDVGMVKQGVANLVTKTFNNPLICALENVSVPLAGKTLTETGFIHVAQAFPHGIMVIGNAPTALLSLCSLIEQKLVSPSLVIGVPVGFVSVVESKIKLAEMPVPQIRVEGRKGGSPVASAILNALIVLAANEQSE